MRRGRRRGAYLRQRRKARLALASITQAGAATPLRTLVSQLRATAGLRRGRWRRRFLEIRRAIDVDALLHALADDANDAGGDVSVGVGRDVSLIAPLVPLRRCLRNLVDNAVKYGGGAVLSATCQAGCVSLTVSDRGPGIPDSELEKVMEPFYRAGQAAGEDGAGLGLAIARLLAERCGGALSLTNRRDGGLDAVVSLPGAETA